MRRSRLWAWLIVLLGVGAALAVDINWIWTDLWSFPSTTLLSSLLPHLPWLAVAGLGVYAVVAVVLSSAVMLMELRRIQARLSQMVPDAQSWSLAFASTSMASIAPRLLNLASPEAASQAGTLILQNRFDSSNARREIAGLYYDWLARTHYLTALLLSLGLTAAGAAQEYGILSISGGIAIPGRPAGLVLALMVLVGVSGRIAVGTATRPFLETISLLPSERLEVGLLRRVYQLLERGNAANPVRVPALNAAALPERVVLALEEQSASVSAAARNLSATAELLASAMRSAVEMVETMASARVEPIAEPSEASRDGLGPVKLQNAIEQLTRAVENLPAADREAAAEARETVGVPRSDLARSQFAQELKSLLAQFD